jgi:paraquat-inducible protein B
MAEPPHRAEPPDIPEAVAAPKSARSIQLVWVIPLIAVLVGGWIAVKTILERGPTITISFKTGEGLEAGKTKIKYKHIEIGLITSIALAPDRVRVVATAQLDKDGEFLLVEDTRFWAVRPQITAAGVTGLGTLLSGPFITVDPGKSTQKRRDFVALDVPPIVTREEPGRNFTLHAGEFGSHDVGVPVFFRHLPVGEVVERKLDKDGKGVSVRIFVRAPYDQYVTASTRFWSASGIDVSLGATGVEIQSESLVSILIGGIAFQARPDAEIGPPAAANHEFQLFRTRAEAMRRPDLDVVHIAFVFKESVRGLAVGAPLEFRGVNVGEVTRIGVEFDPKTFTFTQPVEAHFYPGRLRAQARDLAKMLPLPQSAEEWAKRVQIFVERGLRGQLRAGSLVTGQKYVAINLYPDAPKVKVDASKTPIEIPTVPAPFEELEETITSIAKKLEKVEFGAIGEDLRRTLDSLDKTLKSTDRLVQRVDSELVAETRSVLQSARSAIESAERSVIAPEAPLQEGVREALRELARAAEALRTLADYLERHPEALIRGKQEQP